MAAAPQVQSGVVHQAEDEDATWLIRILSSHADSFTAFGGAKIGAAKKPTVTLLWTLAAWLGRSMLP
jgi:hypothetical protein